MNTKPAPATWAVPNRFATSLRKRLRDTDIDAYIDPSVTGSDRALAHRLMKLMPANRRGDFLYYDGKRFLSNNPAIIAYAKLSDMPKKIASSRSGRIVRGTRAAAASSSGRHTQSTFQCGPPDPYRGSGPYVRNVSQCSFAGGWSIVRVPCGTVSMDSSNDNGFLYLEFSGADGSLYEAGLQMHTGNSDINPYTANLFHNGQQLNNYAARYSCDNYLAIMAGVVDATYPTFYVAIGNVPNYNPANAWQPTEQVDIQNAAWTFIPAPPDMVYPDYDNVGVHTPCVYCSVTKVTSIGQRGGDNWDGSRFGINGADENAIEWFEVTFGEWQNGCEQNALCTIVYSTDASSVYAGQQQYPDNGAAESSFGYNGDVFQSTDGVIATIGTPNRRIASHAMNPPPPSCTPDSYGYCIAMTGGAPLQYQNIVCMVGNYSAQEEMWTGQQWWYVQLPHKVIKYFSYTGVDPNLPGTDCGTQPYWSPAEPKVLYNDPNLP